MTFKQIKHFIRHVGVVALLSATAVSCTENEGIDEEADDTNTPTENKEGLILDSISVWTYQGDTATGVIDNDKMTITLEGITDSSQISEEVYFTSLGGERVNATLYPSLSGQGNWDELSVSLTYEEVYEDFDLSFTYETKYTVISSSHIAPSYQPMISIDITEASEDRAQEIYFIGGDMERAQGYMQSSANPSEVARLAFGEIPFEACRVAYNKRQEEVEGVKLLESCYANAILDMQLIREVNPDLKFWATLKSDYNGYDGENNVPDWIYPNYGKTLPRTFDCEKYAIFLADYLEHMHNNGVGIDYMSTSKEWVAIIDYLNAIEVIEYLNEILPERGVPIPLFSDPGSWGATQGYTYVVNVGKTGKEQLYWGFCTHNLNSSESAEFNYDKIVNAAAALENPSVFGDKYYCIAEESGGGGHGATFKTEPEDLSNMLGVYKQKCEFYRKGIDGELVFEVFSRANNSENRAVSFAPGGEPYVFRCYYILQSFVKGARPYEERGAKVYVQSAFCLENEFGEIEDPDNVYKMCFVDDEKLFVCVVNPSSVDFEGVSLAVTSDTTLDITATVTTHVIEGEIEGIITEGEVYKNNIICDIPALSIVFIEVGIDNEL